MQIKNLFSLALISFISLLMVNCTNTSSTPKDVSEMSEEELTEFAKGIHDRVMTLDTHCDINTSNFTEDKNYTQELETQVNLPKMEEGGLDVPWFIVYTGQGELTEEGYAKAYENAMDKFNAIHRLCEEIAPDRIALATTSEEARRIYAEGKKVAMIGIENGYPVGTDISNVKKFYDLGGRYMSLSHNGHSQLCDSNTGERDSVWMHNGVSELGKEVIKEMNKWGMMIDVSHPSKKSMKDMIELSEAPIIASHSSSRALCDHSRNLDDEQLMWLKENGGVVQTVAFTSYVNTEKANAYNDKRDEFIKEIAAEQGFETLPRSELRTMEPDARQEYINKYREIAKMVEPKMEAIKSEVSPVGVSDFVDHIDYMVKKIGLDHVGISSDFDGGGGVDGWSDASETFNVTLELVRRGYTEEQISQLWSGNLLRVLDEVQAVAKKIQAQES
jgi:microsomal dipeptidase-like Zn-dependent dipeptidase